MKILTTLLGTLIVSGFSLKTDVSNISTLCTPSTPTGIIIIPPGGNGGANCPNMSFTAAVVQNGADYYQWSITVEDSNGTNSYTTTGTGAAISVYVDEFPGLGDPDVYTQKLMVRACSNTPLCGCSSYFTRWVDIDNGC